MSQDKLEIAFIDDNYPDSPIFYTIELYEGYKFLGKKPKYQFETSNGVVYDKWSRNLKGLFIDSDVQILHELNGMQYSHGKFMFKEEAIQKNFVPSEKIKTKKNKTSVLNKKEMDYMCKCNEVVEVKFAKGNETVIIPSKSAEDAGFDIYANFEEESFVINPHETKMISTNLASVIPETHYFQLVERGSTGTKGMAQRCGVIDSGFRSMWFVPITNTGKKPILITKETNKDVLDTLSADYLVYPYKKAICQAVLLPVPKTKVDEITMDELLNFKSERGLGQLGSSKK